MKIKQSTLLDLMEKASTKASKLHYELIDSNNRQSRECALRAQGRMEAIASIRAAINGNPVYLNIL